MIFWPEPFSNTAVVNFKLRDTPLKLDKEVVYLGHHKCVNLKDDSDINRRLRKLHTVGKVIIRKFGICTPEVKRHLFRARCSAAHCSYLWSSFNVMSLRKLRVYHKDILRRLLGEPR